MEPEPLIVVCENCSANNPPERKYCSQCSFPANGTDEEKTKFRLFLSSRKRLLKDAHSKTKSAKIIIYILSGLFLLMGLYYGFGLDDFTTMILNLVLSLVFLIFAAWTKTNPFGAILTAFIVYLTVHIVNAFINPVTLFQGIIWKVIFIGVFIQGIRSAREAQVYLRELEKIKGTPIGSD